MKIKEVFFFYAGKNYYTFLFIYRYVYNILIKFRRAANLYGKNYNIRFAYLTAAVMKKKIRKIITSPSVYGLISTIQAVG